MTEDRPDISIALICYNQRPFIEQTLAGVLLQQFSGTLEIVIGDDCSTDGTREVIRTFAADRNNVRLLLHERNLGMVGNWLSTLDNCRGKYVAICEGDDYWTDPLKLQCQFDALESDPSCCMAWHPVEVLEQGIQVPYPYDEGKDRSTITDLILSHFMPTCSLMYRNGLITSWPEWIWNARSLDIAVEMLLGLHGDAKKIDIKMGVYRQHPQGISKSVDHHVNATLSQLLILKCFNQYSNGAHDAAVRSKMRTITTYSLKLPHMKRLSMLSQRLKVFKFHLYATNSKNFKSLRNEAYLHLIPKTYGKFKRLLGR